MIKQIFDKFYNSYVDGIPSGKYVFKKYQFSCNIDSIISFSSQGHLAKITNDEKNYINDIILKEKKYILNLKNEIKNQKKHFDEYIMLYNGNRKMCNELFEIEKNNIESEIKISQKYINDLKKVIKENYET